MAPKKKKKKDEGWHFVAPPPPELEVLEEQEEVQYTETSYTSASYEVLPPPPPEEPSKKKKKKKEEVIKIRTSSEMFQWSDESIKEEQEKVETPPPKEKKKKGKKGKKDEPKEEIPDFEKPKNWKKMNRKEQDKWMADRIVQWREDMEKEKQAKIAGAKDKRAALARERAELMAKDNAEQEIRRDILQKTCILFSRFERQKRNYDNKKQMKAEWSQYLSCDGLPDPRVVTQMATYLHVWRERGLYDDAELEKRCAEALPMLEMLEEFVANSRQYTEQQAFNYNEIRLQLREQLAYAIEFAAYWLLRDMEKRLKNETITLATYQKQFRSLKLNLWCVVKLPTRLPLPPAMEPEPEPLELAFPAIKVQVTLPASIDARSICVRAARSMIDLLSESSRSYALANDVDNRFEDLFIFNVKEHMDLIKVKKEQDFIRSAFYRQLRERTRELEKLIKSNIYAKLDKEKEELESLYLMEPPYMPDPREFIADENAKNFKKYLRSVNIRPRSGEINLRKYRICGGVLNLDLIITPPQPKRMEYEVELSTLELPKQLRPVDYKVQYRAPKLPKIGEKTLEQIEIEQKKIEAEYEKLAFVLIELPQDVIWSDPPIVCQWQDQRHMWTTNYVNDYQYCKIKLEVTFRTGVLWPIGIATLKYSNLPYLGWDIRPDPKGKGVIVNVLGQKLNITILCVNNAVKLQWVANANTWALKEHFNKRYSVKKLVQLMREAACDFFPDFDAHNYVEGSCPKEWAMERHTYHAMAMLSRAYNFQWSRWNTKVSPRNIIMQAREAVDKKREAKLNLLNITPQRTFLLKYNEDSMPYGEPEEPPTPTKGSAKGSTKGSTKGSAKGSPNSPKGSPKGKKQPPPPPPPPTEPPTVNLEPMMGMTFYPDLFTMNMKYGSTDARRESFNMNFKLVETVFALLQELKLSSFS